VIFVELICDETMIDEKDMSLRDLEGSKGVDLVQDFHMRVQHYKKVVQPNNRTACYRVCSFALSLQTCKVNLSFPLLHICI
jgi:hypothetical protein